GEDDVLHGELRAQAVGDRVRDVPDQRAEGTDVDPAQARPPPAALAGGRLSPSAGEGQQRGLAAPVRSEQHPVLSGLDAQLHRTEDRAAADADGGTAESEDLRPRRGLRHRTATAYGDSSSSWTSPSSSKKRKRSIRRMNHRSWVTA